MAKTLPYKGEFLNSFDYPAPLRCARLTMGASSDNDVVLGDAATYNLFTVPAGTLVHEIASRVVTAVTASVTITIGDSDSAAGFLASADLAPQSTGVLLVSSRGAAEAYAGGKIYDAEQSIQAVTAAATVAAGVVEVYMIYSMAGAD